MLPEIESLTTVNNLVDTIQKTINSRISCAKIGKINTFYPSSQTATIEIMIKNTKKQDDQGNVKVYDHPLLVDCPVIILGNKTDYDSVPIHAGDECLVIFNDFDIDNWYESGQACLTKTTRKHDINDGIAIVGVRSKANAIENYDNDARVLNYGDAQIKIKNGKVSISNTSKSLKTLIDDLISTIAGVTTVDGKALSPTDITDLNTIKSEFSSLLES